MKKSLQKKFIEKRTHSIEKTITIAQVQGAKVRELFLNDEICENLKFGRRKTDRFICINGMLEILDLNNNTSHVLQAGESLPLMNNTNQCVKSYDGNICKFMIVKNH